MAVAAAGARQDAAVVIKLGGAVVHVVGMTGSSGSGVAPQAGTHHPVRAVNLKTYKVLEHQHTPEILETLAAAGAPDVTLGFVPVSAPLSRGILANSAGKSVDAADHGPVRSLARNQRPALSK